MPCVYWTAIIFVVVADFSILFFTFTFLLDSSHFIFCYELVIRSETTGVMKSIRKISTEEIRKSITAVKLQWIIFGEIILVFSLGLRKKTIY